MTDSDDIVLRRKRVLYRAQHRGTQEMDLLLGGYVAAHLDRLDSPMLDRLEALMETEETDLQAWLMAQNPVPEDADVALIEEIRRFRLEEAKR